MKKTLNDCEKMTLDLERFIHQIFYKKALACGINVFEGLVYYTIMLKINAEIDCRNNFQLKFCCVLLGENDKWLKKINLHFKCSNFIFDVSVESF